MRGRRCGIGMVGLWVIVLWPSGGVWCQQPPWQRIGTGQGLPDASITCIYRMPDGTLCGGTHDGIVMMAGTRFERVTTSADLNSQVNPFINCITSGSGGILYAGSRNALWRYDPALKKRSTLIHPWGLVGGIQHLAFSADSTYLMASTNKGLLKIPLPAGPLRITDSFPVHGAMKSWMVGGKWYVFAYPQGIFRLDGRRFTPVVEEPGMLDVLWLDRRQQWLVLTACGLDLFSADGKKQEQVKGLFKPGELPGIPHMYTDDDGDIYIQTVGGLLRVDGRALEKQFHFTPEKDNEYSLGNAAVSYYYKDHEGTSWVSTSGAGLCYIAQKPGDLLFLSNNILGCATAWSLFADPVTRKLWIGTDHGIRFGTFDGVTFQPLKNLLPPGVTKFTVTGIRPFNEDALFVCTFGHGCWLANRVTGVLRPVEAVNRILSNRNIYGATLLADGRVLVLTQDGAVVWEPARQRAETWAPGETQGHFNLSACQLQDGNILIGDGTGLLCTGDDGIFRWRLQNRPGDTTTVSSNVIIHMAVMADKTVALGTMGGGLCLFDPMQKKFRRVRLVTNPANIYGIIETEPGMLFLTTSNGLCLYRSREGTSSMLNQENLLPFNDFNQFAFASGEDHILAAGEKGVILLRRDRMAELFLSSEKTGIRRHGILCDSVLLPPGSSAIELSITPVNALPHKKMQFRYRLDGFEAGWHDLPAGQDQVVYNFLPPGYYRLRVEATDRNNLFRAPPAFFPIRVKPHFWQTTTFRLLAGILLLAFLIALVRYLSQIRLTRKLRKLEDEQKLSRERARISRELHDNVGSQLTYLISGLEASGYHLEKNNTVKLADDLRSLQDSARESMQQLRQAIWTLNRDEITVEALAGQFRGWLARIMEPHTDIAWNMETNISREVALDPLTSLNLFRMMQESVHNVVKHAGPCTLEIRIESSGSGIVVRIADTGKGFTPGTQEGTGMGSMRARAAEAGMQLELHSRPGKGTEVVITSQVK